MSGTNKNVGKDNMTGGPEFGSTASPAIVPRQYLIPFALTTACFALWGFANDFTNPLVKVYENVFIITTDEQSGRQGHAKIACVERELQPGRLRRSQSLGSSGESIAFEY